MTYSLACPIAGWLGDRQDRLRLAAAGAFAWSAATVASGLAPTYGWLLAARAMIGVGEASYGVVTPSILSDCYRAEQRPWALGVFYAAIPVGSALGYIVGGVVGATWGWRAAFFIAGVPAAEVVPSAISNTVFDAIGVRLRTVPFTPDRVKAAARAQVQRHHTIASTKPLTVPRRQRGYVLAPPARLDGRRSPRVPART